MHEPARRVLLRRILQFTASCALAPVALEAARAAGTCVDPASETLRTSLHYSNPSAKSGEICSGCAFFSAAGSGSTCGNCQIMSGPVDAGGHCDSWAAKG
jgi:High potential iron-sulfur protein